MYSKVSYKYRVKELLNSLPAKDRDTAMKELPAYLEISRNTLSKIMNVSTENSYEPAAGTLIKLALFLGVSAEDLLSSKPEPITIDQLRVINSSKTAAELSLSKL